MISPGPVRTLIFKAEKCTKGFTSVTFKSVEHVTLRVKTAKTVDRKTSIFSVILPHYFPRGSN